MSQNMRCSMSITVESQAGILRSARTSRDRGGVVAEAAVMVAAVGATASDRVATVAAAMMAATAAMADTVETARYASGAY